MAAIRVPPLTIGEENVLRALDIIAPAVQDCADEDSGEVQAGWSA